MIVSAAYGKTGFKGPTPPEEEEEKKITLGIRGPSYLLRTEREKRKFWDSSCILEV